jgi:hypothetical protein
LRGQSSRYGDREPDLLGFPASKDDFEPGSDEKVNFAEEVIGEIGSRSLSFSELWSPSTWCWSPCT